MNNKILVEIIVPDIEESYDIFIPINRRIGSVISLINKALYELTNESFKISDNRTLCNQSTGKVYLINEIVRQTDIRNGTKLILI